MAMTKKERETLAALARDLRKARALRFPDYQPTPLAYDPAKDIGSGGRNWRRGNLGWSFDLHALTVFQGCFTDYHHTNWLRDGLPTNDRWSQFQGGPWYASKAEALMALRVAATEQAATRLANIDLAIEQALAEAAAATEETAA